MKTKDLIKLLQETDPSGEAYIRIEGGIIWGAELKEGYWDGPYNYIKKDENGKINWVKSAEGNKVDIYVMDLFDFVEKYDGDWEEIKKHLVFEGDYISEDRKEDFLKFAKKECDEYNEILLTIKK